MEHQVTWIDPDIFTVSNIFSAEECLELTQRAEAIGFEAASVRTSNGPQMLTHIRNNDRAVLPDPQLAAEMWQRIRAFLPVLDGCVASGVDTELRFYRYVPGQHFKRHKDGSVTSRSGHTSKLSYLVYLNDDCDGGSTTFREYRDINGHQEKLEQIISPTAGTALLFRHERWHEGSPVISGVKYVLRTDVFYMPGESADH
jgi:predicted 2-oxoglutarate/Fe(II)-dependent dioxygenase YbiX